MYLEGAHQRLIHTHHAPGIVKLAAVVGSREQRHQLPLGKELVTIFNHLEEKGGGHRQAAVTISAMTESAEAGRYTHLMGSANEVQVVAVQKFADHVGSERE